MQYGIKHVPIMATVQPNRRKGGDPVAFVDGQLCFFERGTPTPPVGSTVEVMVTRPVYGKSEQGGVMRNDFGRIAGLMIQVVDPALHVLVAIEGFECSGTMCRTTAHGAPTDGSRPLTSEDVYPQQRPRESRSDWLRRTRGSSMWLTPGRSGIREAHNVNVRHDRSNEKPRVPTNVWVERAILEETAGCGVRVAGLTRFEDLECAKLLRRPRMAA